MLLFQICFLACNLKSCSVWEGERDCEQRSIVCVCFVWKNKQKAFNTLNIASLNNATFSVQSHSQCRIEIAATFLFYALKMFSLLCETSS